MEGQASVLANSEALIDKQIRCYEKRIKALKRERVAVRERSEALWTQIHKLCETIWKHTKAKFRQNEKKAECEEGMI